MRPRWLLFLSPLFVFPSLPDLASRDIPPRRCLRARKSYLLLASARNSWRIASSYMDPRRRMLPLAAARGLPRGRPMATVSGAGLRDRRGRGGRGAHTCAGSRGVSQLSPHQERRIPHPSTVADAAFLVGAALLLRVPAAGLSLDPRAHPAPHGTAALGRGPNVLITGLCRRAPRRRGPPRPVPSVPPGLHGKAGIAKELLHSRPQSLGPQPCLTPSPPKTSTSGPSGSTFAVCTRTYAPRSAHALHSACNKVRSRRDASNFDAAWLQIRGSRGNVISALVARG